MLSLFNHYLAGLYYRLLTMDQGPIVRKIYFGILSKTLVLKFKLQFERTFIVHHVHQKLSFLMYLMAHA